MTLPTNNYTGSGIRPISFLLNDDKMLSNFTTSIEYSTEPHQIIIKTATGLNDSNKVLLNDYLNSLHGTLVTFDFGTGYLTKARFALIQKGTMLTFDNLQQVKKDTPTTHFKQSKLHCSNEPYTILYDEGYDYPVTDHAIKTNTEKDIDTVSQDEHLSYWLKAYRELLDEHTNLLMKVSK